MIIFTVIVWLVLCIFIGVGASKRGRSGFGWFMLSALLSPLVGGIGLLMCGNKEEYK